MQEGYIDFPKGTNNLAHWREQEIVDILIISEINIYEVKSLE